MSVEDATVEPLDDSTININRTTTTITATSAAAVNRTDTAQSPSDGCGPMPVTPSAETMARLSGDALELHCRNVEDELRRLRDTEQRLKQQNADSKRREHILIRRLALKEQELLDYANQITEFKNGQVPTPVALRTALLDPAVNLLLQKLRAELQTTRARLEDTQNELSAWKFTPDSNTGKRLMAKCRLLYQENEELGRMTSNGRMAKLEGDLALQKSFSEEVKKSQSELDDFLQELDEDVEGMQSTILFLQQELKTAKDTVSGLESELTQLRQSQPTVDEAATLEEATGNDIVAAGATAGTAQNGDNDAMDDTPVSAQLPTNGVPTGGAGDVAAAAAATIVECSAKSGASDDRTALGPQVSVRTLRSGRRVSTEDHHATAAAARVPVRSNGDAVLSGGGNAIVELDEDEQPTPNGTLSGVAAANGNKRSFDESNDTTMDASQLEQLQKQPTAGAAGVTVVSAKKIRRSSVLSLELNEEDSRIDCEDERTLPVQSVQSCNGSVAEDTATSAAAVAATTTTVVSGGGGAVVQ